MDGGKRKVTESGDRESQSQSKGMSLLTNSKTQQTQNSFFEERRHSTPQSSDDSEDLELEETVACSHAFNLALTKKEIDNIHSYLRVPVVKADSYQQNYDQKIVHHNFRLFNGYRTFLIRTSTGKDYSYEFEGDLQNNQVQFKFFFCISRLGQHSKKLKFSNHDLCFQPKARLSTIENWVNQDYWIVVVKMSKVEDHILIVIELESMKIIHQEIIKHFFHNLSKVFSYRDGQLICIYSEAYHSYKKDHFIGIIDIESQQNLKKVFIKPNTPTHYQNKQIFYIKGAREGCHEKASLTSLHVETLEMKEFELGLESLSLGFECQGIERLGNNVVGFAY